MLFFIHTPYSENTRISKHSYYFWSSSNSRLWILSFSSYGYQQAHTVVYLQTVRRGALRVGGRVDSTNVKATVSIQKASVARYNVTFYLWFESNQQWYQSRCFSFQFIFCAISGLFVLIFDQGEKFLEKYLFFRIGRLFFTSLAL